MSTVAWLFLIVAVLILRQVSKGRIMELPGDLRDFFVAGVSGDVTAIREIAGRAGTGLTPDAVSAPMDFSEGTKGTVGGGSTSLVTEMRRLAAQANYRYRWGGTTTSGYDCSGLIWRALVNLLGIKKVGGRFTTLTFGKASKGYATVVSSPQVGDIVVWTGHMGVVIGNDRMFSALSTKAGIVESAISAERGTPVYYRVTA